MLLPFLRNKLRHNSLLLHSFKRNDLHHTFSHLFHRLRRWSIAATRDPGRHPVPVLLRSPRPKQAQETQPLQFSAVLGHREKAARRTLALDGTLRPEVLEWTLAAPRRLALLRPPQKRTARQPPGGKRRGGGEEECAVGVARRSARCPLPRPWPSPVPTGRYGAETRSGPLRRSDGRGVAAL